MDESDLIGVQSLHSSSQQPCCLFVLNTRTAYIVHLISRQVILCFSNDTHQRIKERRDVQKPIGCLVADISKENYMMNWPKKHTCQEKYCAKYNKKKNHILTEVGRTFISRCAQKLCIKMWESWNWIYCGLNIQSYIVLDTNIVLWV